MFRSGRSSTEYHNEPRTETGSTIPGSPSYQNNESSTISPPETAPARPLAESAMIAREIREGTLSAFVGAGTKINAEVSFKLLLRIDGLLSGRITSDEGTLVVAAAGRVEANVTVAIARINGSVTGDIFCSERIELGATAKVTGNIQAPTLIIEQGAVLDGRCRMTPEPEPAIVSEPQVVATEIVAPVEAVAGPHIAAAEDSVAEPATAAATEAVASVEAVAAAQVTAAEALVAEPAKADPQKTEVTKMPKVARKANVMKAKPKRGRTKVATAKTADDEAANDEKAAVAAG